jgi:hypothetical protein
LNQEHGNLALRMPQKRRGDDFITGKGLRTKCKSKSAFARRAGGQGDDGFISENKRNVKRKRVRRRGDIQRDCEARDAS